MNLSPFIDEVALQAEDILAGIKDRLQARASLDEFVSLDYPKLDPTHRKKVVADVMAVLESDGVFGERFVDSFDADQNADDNEDH